MEFIFSTMIYQSLVIVLSSIVVDTVLGILVAIKKKEFNVSLLPNFLTSNILPYIGGLIILAFISSYLTELEYLYYAAAAAVTLKFSKEALLDKVKELFG